MPAEHPTGEYQAKVLDHGFNKATTGTSQFWAKFETDKGEIVGYFALTDRAVEYTAEKVRAMGFEGGDWRALADGSALRGAICQIEVKAETYNGKTRNKVTGVWPAGGSRPGLDHDDSVAANVARFNAVLKRTPVAGQPSQDPPIRSSRSKGPSVEEFDAAEAADAANAARGEEFEPNPEDIPF